MIVKQATAGDSILEFISQMAYLCCVDKLSIGTEKMKQKGSGIASRVYPHMEIFVFGLLPQKLEEQAQKMRKRIAVLEASIQAIGGRLHNAVFVSKAPEEVIEKEKERKFNFEKELHTHRKNLALFHD